MAKNTVISFPTDRCRKPRGPDVEQKILEHAALFHEFHVHPRLIRSMAELDAVIENAEEMLDARIMAAPPTDRSRHAIRKLYDSIFSIHAAPAVHEQAKRDCDAAFRRAEWEVIDGDHQG